MKELSELEIGDEVYHDGDSGFCHLSTLTITEIETRYDTKTGVLYKVICCGKMKFDSRTGHAINPPLAYYISPKNL